MISLEGGSTHGVTTEVGALRYGSKLIILRGILMVVPYQISCVKVRCINLEVFTVEHLSLCEAAAELADMVQWRSWTCVSILGRIFAP